MLILHDKRLPREYKDALTDMFQGVRLLSFDSGPATSGDKVYASILHHPDIYFFKLDNNTIVHAPGIDEMYLSSLREMGMELVSGKKDPVGKYPDTARYNAVSLGDTLFHCLLYTDPAVIETARKKGFELVNVDQGYTRCSTVIVGEDGLISSDGGIIEQGKKAGKDVLRVPAGSVLLPGENMGFLGGASGTFEDGDVLFLGDLDLHEHGRDIRNFISNHGKKCMELKKLPLFDAGSVLII